MNKFSKFYFEGFSFDNKLLTAKFTYSFDKDEYFEEVIDFKSKFFHVRKNLDLNILNNILFSLHIALGISYYKSYPTKKLIVNSGILTSEQINFWKKFYLNGLGEFLYVNKISPKGLFNFVNNSDIKYVKKDFKLSEKSLVPVGGGKDSIVSIELLKEKNINFDLFVFGKIDKLKENCGNISNKKTLLVKRKISENLFKLNSEGYFNGHVPITGIIAFNMLTVSYLYNYKYLILSNEKSANFGNTQYKGFTINHQYSKSLEFEKDFKEYIENNISCEIKYFSLLRGMYEIKIAEIFSKYGKKYFSKFSSCNNNFKILCKSDKIKKGKYWCNNCSKCLFVFIILRPFLNNKEVLDIFGEDLFENKNLETIFRELLGISGIKPLECVGESNEVLVSLCNIIKMRGIRNNSTKLPYLLNIFSTEVYNKIDLKDIKKLEKKLVTIYDDDIIPENFKNKIINSI